MPHKHRSLIEAWETHEAESQAFKHPDVAYAARLHFYGGALLTLVAIRNGADPTALLREALDFSKTIGRHVPSTPERTA